MESCFDDKGAGNKRRPLLFSTQYPARIDSRLSGFSRWDELVSRKWKKETPVNLLNAFLDDPRSRTINPIVLQVANFLALQIPIPKERKSKEPTRRARWIEEFLAAYTDLPDGGLPQLEGLLLLAHQSRHQDAGVAGSALTRMPSASLSTL